MVKPASSRGDLGGKPMTYPIVIFWSDEDQAFIADTPDLRYCSAHGETPEEALREARVAQALWLEVACDDGRPLPEPRFRRGSPRRPPARAAT